MTWYMMKSRGIWRRIGRQPENWLTPYAPYIAWVSSKIACAVALVPALDLPDLGREELGRPHRDGLLPEERDERDPDDDRQQDDRDADVADQLVEADQDDEDELEDRREQPREQAERVGSQRAPGGAASGSAWGSAPRRSRRATRPGRRHRRTGPAGRRWRAGRARPGTRAVVGGSPGSIVPSSFNGPGRSRRDARGDSARCAGRPSSCPAGGRSFAIACSV